MKIRKAEIGDIPQIAEIYDSIHTEDEAGRLSVGWQRGVYPVKATAEAALSRNELYVGEENGTLIGSAVLNHVQLDCYREGTWAFPARKAQVFVMHTLAIDPAHSKNGYGRAFVRFYETLAAENGCLALRIDTQEKNTAARKLYQSCGFREAGLIPCEFNGIPGVSLVLLEKAVSE